MGGSFFFAFIYGVFIYLFIHFSSSFEALTGAQHQFNPTSR